MPCASCGAENPPGTKFCANCGAALVSGAPSQGQAPGYAQQSQAQGFGGAVAPQGPRAQTSVSIDFRRLGIGDIVSIGGSILLFISLFLTWYTVPNGGGSTSALGTGAGGWRVLILVLDILILLYLFVRTMTPRGFRLPLPHWQLLTVFLGLQFLLTLLAFLVKPSVGVSISWGYGAFIGLVAAAVALAGGIMRRSEPEIVVPGVPHGGFGTFRATPQQPPIGVTPGGGAQGTLCAQCGTAVAPGTPYCTTCGAPVQG
ncbi:MAG: zinc ribbon domain-containing protein [Acidimicrobiales bacterium]